MNKCLLLGLGFFFLSVVAVMLSVSGGNEFQTQIARTIAIPSIVAFIMFVKWGIDYVNRRPPL